MGPSSGAEAIRPLSICGRLRGVFGFAVRTVAACRWSTVSGSGKSNANLAVAFGTRYIATPGPRGLLPLEGTTVPGTGAPNLFAYPWLRNLFEALLEHSAEDFSVMVSALYRRQQVAAVNFCLRSAPRAPCLAPTTSNWHLIRPGARCNGSSLIPFAEPWHSPDRLGQRPRKIQNVIHDRRDPGCRRNCRFAPPDRLFSAAFGKAMRDRMRIRDWTDGTANSGLDFVSVSELARMPVSGSGT